MEFQEYFIWAIFFAYAYLCFEISHSKDLAWFSFWSAMLHYKLIDEGIMAIKYIPNSISISLISQAVTLFPHATHLMQLLPPIS